MIRDFYLQQSAPADRVDAILEAAALNVEVRRWKRIAISTSIGLAVTLLLACGFWIRSIPDRGVMVIENRPDGDTDTEITIPDLVVDPAVVQMNPPSERNPQPTVVEVPSNLVEPPYLLVALQTHGDACPFCRETGKTYRELERQLDSDLVQLEQFQLGDLQAKAENDTRIAAFQLGDLIAGRSETAFLALTTRQGDVVRQFKPSLGGQAIVDQVSQIVAADRLKQ
jgi:hypothetical protein